MTAELPPFIKEEGIDIEIVTPLYSSTKRELYSHSPSEAFRVRYQGRDENVEVYQSELSGVPVNLVKNGTYFEGGSEHLIFIALRSHTMTMLCVLRFFFFFPRPVSG